MAISNPIGARDVVFIQRSLDNTVYGEVHVSGTLLIFYTDEIGRLTADKASDFYTKFPPGGGGATTLYTGSTYPITSSWAVSASWAPDAGTTLFTSSTYPITSSWASSSVTSSYVTNEANHTGINGRIIQFSSGSTNLWHISSSGHILPNVNNSYNIGSSTFHVSNVHTEFATVYNAIGCNSLGANDYITAVRVTASLQGNVTGSLFGTSSWAQRSTIATSASWASSSLSASYLTTTNIYQAKQFRAAVATITYAGTTNIDLDAAAEQEITATGDLTLTTSNRAAGKSVLLRIEASGVTVNMTYPAWIPYGAALPTSIADGDAIYITLRCRGSAESNIDAVGMELA